MKCDSICNQFCSGPADRITNSKGQIEFLPNDNCPSRAPELIVSGSEGANRFVFYGQACYSYSLNQIYYLVPAFNETYTIRQDYNLDKYPFMEKSIPVIDPESGIVPVKNSITSCVAVRQDTYFIAGFYLRLTTNVAGSTYRKPESQVVSQRKWIEQQTYYRWIQSGLDFGWAGGRSENFNLISVMRETGLILIASVSQKLLLVLDTAYSMNFRTEVVNYLKSDHFPSRLVPLIGNKTLVLWHEQNYRSVATVSNEKMELTPFVKLENVAGRDLNADYNKMPFQAEENPRIAILIESHNTGEHKVEILRSTTFEQDKVILISEW